MAEDIDKVERARLARKAIIDHMDCDDCTEDYVFLLRQGGREFGMGLTTVLSMLAFAEHEGAVPPLSTEWWIKVSLVLTDDRRIVLRLEPISVPVSGGSPWMFSEQVEEDALCR